MALNGNDKILDALLADGIAKQKLHVILLVDTSRSMKGKRIGQVNSAIADIHKYLIDLQDENSNVDFYMSILTFSDKAEFLSGYRAVNVKNMTPPTLSASGYSNLHSAYEELASVLRKESAGGLMPDFGGVAPVILLITDGHPTSATKKQLESLSRLPWFRAALRYGIAIELKDERTVKVLTDFTEDPSCVISCFDSNLLSKIIRVIVMTASKVKSQSVGVRACKKIKSAIPIDDPHIAIKQQVKDSLDEIEDCEW